MFTVSRAVASTLNFILPPGKPQTGRLETSLSGTTNYGNNHAAYWTIWVNHGDAHSEGLFNDTKWNQSAHWDCPAQIATVSA